MVDELLEGLYGGHGFTLVLHGEPGIGKTAMLEHAGRSPRLKILQTTAVEFETMLAFSALHQLCGAEPERIDRLPAPQGDALKTAFGLSGGQSPDQFRVGLALLTILAEAAVERPVLCLVDDAQWLDTASAQALAFAARRVRDERIGFLFAVRDIEERPELAGFPRMPLAGLSESAAESVLATRIRAPLDPEIRQNILAEARGNPLALLELPRTIDVAGGFVLPAALPPSSRVEASFTARLRELPSDTRLLLLLAAAEPTGNALLLWRAAKTLGIEAAAATAAVQTALISFTTRVRFRHPLVRSAAYRSASADDLRSVHAALAAATDRNKDPDRHAWHCAQAAIGPDDGIADALERSAGSARARGGVAAAAAFLAESARLTPEPGLRAARAFAAARAKHDAGAMAAALDLLAVVEAEPLGALQRAEAQAMRARIGFDQDRSDQAVPHLLRAAKAMAPLQAEAAQHTLLEALAAAASAGRFAHPATVQDVASAALPVIGREGGGTSLGLLLDALATQASAGFAAAVPKLRQAVDTYSRGSAGSEAGTGEIWMMCCAAMDLWDDVNWRVIAEQQLRDTRARGALAALPVTLNHRALVHVHNGEFDDASALVDDAYAIAADIGSPGLSHVDVTVAAWRGDKARAVRLARAAMDDARTRREGRLLTAVEHAQAVLFNGLGEYDAALQACQAACALDEPGFQAWVPHEFLEAATRTGDRELARPVLRRLCARAEAGDTPWALGTALRARALFADGEEAESLYRQAIEQFDKTQGVAQAARARLVYGEWLRREGRRLDARRELQMALETFSLIGARAFEARAARELRTTGAHLRRRPADGPPRLTDQELQIARMVATGATSKEVGMQLFLSPRTIDAHLRNIFKKLGINSRRQLRDSPHVRLGHQDRAGR